MRQPQENTIAKIPVSFDITQDQLLDNWLNKDNTQKIEQTQDLSLSANHKKKFWEILNKFDKSNDESNMLSSSVVYNNNLLKINSTVNSHFKLKNQ